MSKLPAFTLLETLLALVLMAVVGTMATAVMQHLGNSSAHFRERHAEEAELVELNVALRTDLARATHVMRDPLGRMLFIGRADTIRYAVLADSTVERRIPGRTMVFLVRAITTPAALVPGTDLVTRWQLNIAGPGEQRALVVTHTPLTAARLNATLPHGHPHTR
jgi:type II secretory pathway pseudopilin PulG